MSVDTKKRVVQEKKKKLNILVKCAKKNAHARNSKRHFAVER